MEFEWEILNHDDGSSFRTFRAKVIGGWLVRNITWYDHDEFQASSLCESMVFVPDPKHEWGIE